MRPVFLVSFWESLVGNCNLCTPARLFELHRNLRRVFIGPVRDTLPCILVVPIHSPGEREQLVSHDFKELPRSDETVRFFAHLEFSSLFGVYFKMIRHPLLHFPLVRERPVNALWGSINLENLDDSSLHRI
jgi:hypothetical protein